MPLRKPDILRLFAWAASFFLLLAASCGDDNPAQPVEPEDPEPGYSIERPQGVAIGWSRLSALPQADSHIFEASYHLPGHPFEDRVDILFTREESGWSYDWSLGSEGGPALGARIAREPRGDWAYVHRGWGELRLVHELAPAEHSPLPLDFLSPLSYALLGWRWEEAGAPESLDLIILRVDEPGSEPDSLPGHLVYEGELVEQSFDLRAFRLEMDDGTLFFKLMVEHFPLPLSTWWDRDQVALRFWNGIPDLSHLAFGPEFPVPEGYVRQNTTIAEGDLSLAMESARPDGVGPFPAVLLLADDGPADRDDAALFGHLSHELARHGWLTYRYDKPGTGLSTGDLDSLDLGGRRRALAAAWQAMRDDPQADPARCLLLGHGEGAALALERAALDDEAAGVIALAPPRYRPDGMPQIPEAIAAPGDHIEFLGLDCFVDKYRDLLAFDSEAYLSEPGWEERPVALFRGDEDEIVSYWDIEEQVSLLMTAGALVTVEHFPGMRHFMNSGRPDEPPDAALVDEILAWLDANFP